MGVKREGVSGEEHGVWAMRDKESGRVRQRETHRQTERQTQRDRGGAWDEEERKREKERAGGNGMGGGVASGEIRTPCFI